MTKARFAYDNKALMSTITASASATGYPATNLASTARWKKWRSSTTTGNQNVDFDFGTNKTIKAVVLVGWKAHAGGTIKAQTWNGAAWVDFGTFTQPSANPTGVIAVWNTVGVSTQKVRILFTNTGAVSAYVELGVVFAGDYFSPSFNLSDGFKVERCDLSLISSSDGGNESAQQKSRYFEAEGDFEFVTNADRASFVAMFENVGIATPLFFALDPDDPDFIFYARFADKLRTPHVVRASYNVPVAFKEAL